jgi:IS1 family transposase
MKTRNIPGRGLAILVGLAFLLASLSALFGEDLTNWHAWTMKHYEVLAILFGATASGLLCRYAKRARMWIACAAFALLFVATTGLVVYKSLGRQAASTATQTMSAEDSNKLIATKMGDLDTTRQRLADAEREVDYERKGRPDRNGKPTTKAGCGDRCKDWERRAAEVQSRVQVLEQEIRGLGPRQIAAPEAENFAQLLGMFGWSAPKVKALAVLLVPVLWTMVLEAGTIACFEYAFSGKPHLTVSDSAQTSFDATNLAETKIALANSDPENDPPRGGRKTKSSPRTSPANLKARTLPANVVPIRGKHPVISALEFAGKPLSNEELAAAMGVCGGESTKRRREVAHLLEQRRQGHRVLIKLKGWQQATA